MLVNRNPEQNRLMALNHDFAWQKKKKKSIHPIEPLDKTSNTPQTQTYSLIQCPGALPHPLCPP